MPARRREGEELSLHTNLRYNTKALEIYSMFLFMAWCKLLLIATEVNLCRSIVNCLASQPPAYITFFRNLLATIEFNKRAANYFQTRHCLLMCRGQGGAWSAEQTGQRPGAAREKLPSL